VTSGLTLIAFVVAIAFNAYRLKLKARVDLVKNTSPSDRLRAISATVEMFHINIKPGTLTPDALERVVLEQMRLKERRTLLLILATVFLAFLLVIVAVVAMLSEHPSRQIRNPPPATTPSLNTQNDTPSVAPIINSPPRPIGVQTAQSNQLDVQAARTQPCDADSCANRVLLTVTLPPAARYIATHYFSTAGYPDDVGVPMEMKSREGSWSKYSEAEITTDVNNQTVITVYYYNRSTRDRKILIKVDYEY
jgi:hypothetical protein